MVDNNAICRSLLKKRLFGLQNGVFFNEFVSDIHYNTFLTFAPFITNGQLSSPELRRRYLVVTLPTPDSQLGLNTESETVEVILISPFSLF